MIALIAKKDFLLNLISVRFVIGFVLCLVIIPFTMVVSMDEFENQMRIYKVDQDAADNEFRNLRVYSALRPTVVKKPEALGIFSRGINPNIGNATKVSLQEYPLFPKGHTSSRDNPLLNAFFSLDFATVIAIVISLLALVFSYDSITREREDGTMKLVMTNAVSRITFLIGKLAGLLLTLLPILIFCYILACLIIIFNPNIQLTASDWTGIALLLLTSIVYMLVFIILGMFISSLTTQSSSSIVLCLLCWIGFLFIVPNMATYLSKSISRTPLYDNVQAVIDEYHSEYWNKYWPTLQEKAKEIGVRNFGWENYDGGDDGYENLSGGRLEVAQTHRLKNLWSEPYRMEMADKIWPIQKDYLDKLILQQKTQQYLSWLSPSEIFGQATDALCRTDMQAFLRYMETQREYRQTMIRYFMDNNLFGSFRYFTPQPEEDFIPEQEIDDYYAGKGGRIYADDWSPSNYPNIDTSDVPRYVYVMSSPMQTFQAALGRLAALLLISIVLLGATIARFMKYDVR
ncbi:ABC transporter permease subunit [Bacteroides sp. OttesenSCG-928-D19]|nr:ABC transporter permease subunit [Bacteroides sp. OttesenSCG-928-D19]